MTESEKQYYERKHLQYEKKRKAIAKAQKRGEIASKWFETNKLTPETKLEFNKLMKDTDRAFENDLLKPNKK